MNEKIGEPKTVSDIADVIKQLTDIGLEMWVEKLNNRQILKTEMTSNLLFRQILEMGDAIHELIKAGCVNASKPLVRTLLESYFQFKYLTIDNEERKALQFLYHYEMGMKEHYKKLAFPKTGGSLFEKIKNDKLMKGFNFYKPEYLDNIKKIEETLSSDDYKEIAIEYERTAIKKRNTRTGKVGKVKFWYELFDGPTSIDIMAVELKEAALYEIIYRMCSSYSHGEDIVHANLEPTGEDTLGISALRDLRQLDVVGDYSIMLLKHSITAFLPRIKNKQLLLKLIQLKQKNRRKI